jgi:RNA-directed DNA polymerase
MAKGGSETAVEELKDQEAQSLVNIDDPDREADLWDAERRVLEIQTKLHRWATADRGRRFDDLFNLVTDPAFLRVAWERVRSNKGAATAGVDRVTARLIEAVGGQEEFLSDLRADLKAGRFTPLPVRERMIPKAGGKLRRLGIPTITDRVVQAALKLVLEPIFEADFHPCSYGFRPNRRAQDAIAEIHHYGSLGYDWVLEGDIKACFDMIDHTALMDRVRRRVGDKRVLRLVKAFLKAGIMDSLGEHQETITGTPQGGILSPLLANIALSTLDDHVMSEWNTVMSTSMRRKRRGWKGLGNWRLIRYADDFVVLVHGTRDNTEALRAQVAEVLAPVGLSLSEEKTTVVNMDEGFDFLGFRIQRHRQRGTDKRYIYTYPSKKALASIKGKIKTLTSGKSNRSLSDLLLQLNRMTRGWAMYFRHAASSKTFSYVGQYAWQRVVGWVRRKHKGLNWGQLRRRYLPRWRPTEDEVTLYYPATIPIRRYRYRGYSIPNPWTAATTEATA